MDDFYSAKQGYGKRQSRCKLCQNGRRWENGRFRDEEQKQRILAANRQSYDRNKDKHLRRQFDRKLAWKIKAINVLGGRCFDCECDHPLLLEFDHRDPSQKLFEITKAVSCPNKYPWDLVLIEIQKCDLRCRNCHMLRHVAYELSQDGDMWIVGDRKLNGGQKGSKGPIIPR